MKLIFCSECQDIVRLHRFPRACYCGKSWGHYEADGLHAIVGGSAIPVGFLNNDFRKALRLRPDEGLGECFTSFVIPKSCPTVGTSNAIIRTSMTDPLRIATLYVPGGGAIGLTFAPGKHQSAAMSGGTWIRSLSADLAAIRAWRTHTLLTLLEPQEMAEMGILGLPSQASACGMQWHGLPITDGDVPDERFLGPWLELGPQFIRGLRRGERIVVHCKGGLGRAGIVACLLLHGLRLADSAADAMTMVRVVRPGSVETLEQEQFLRAWFDLIPETGTGSAYLAYLRRAIKKARANSRPTLNADASDLKKTDIPARLTAEFREALRAKGVK